MSLTFRSPPGERTYTPHSGGVQPAAEPAPLSPWWLWWGATTAWWTVSALISAAQLQSMRVAMGESASWLSALVPAAASSYLWVPLTMLALWTAARFPVERDRVAVPLLVHAAGGAFATVARMVAVLVLNPWIGWYSEVPPVPQLFVASLNNNLVIYWLLVGVGHAVHYARAARRQRLLLTEAQLLALKAQLQPHFLFNTLNTISSFVRTDADAAERMIDRLGRLLRHSLETGTEQEVSLRDELAALEPYIDIELTRFADRLTIDSRVDSDVLDAAVPHLIMQPIVENAIRHGIAPRSLPGTVAITASREGDDVVIRVIDDGVGLRRAGAASERGVGLRNTRDRLSHLYGGEGRLTLRDAPGGGAMTVVRVPYRTMTERR